ncbi:MAG: hypothetical protein IPM23_20775 [Candidatus Melainabacteria bacterium]|nr:hypothetical protein [Candidatus Melainabacteria bacterium]
MEIPPRGAAEKQPESHVENSPFAENSLYKSDMRGILDPHGGMDFSPKKSSSESVLGNMIKTGISWLPSAESLLGGGEKQPANPARSPEDNPESQATEKLLAGILAPSSLAMLDNIDSLKIASTGRPNELSVVGDLAASVTMKAPNAIITGLGPLGGVTARPCDTTLDNFSFNLRTDPGDLDDIRLYNMRGFNGGADLFRRGRNIGSRASSTQWMHFDVENNGYAHVDVKSTSAKTAYAFDRRHFDSQGLAGRMVSDPEFRENVLSTLHKFEKSVDSLEIRKTGAGRHQLTIDPDLESMPLNKPVKSMPGFTASNIYFKKEGAIKADIDTTGSEKSVNFQKGDLEIGLISPLGKESRLSIASIFTTRAADGREALKVRFFGIPGEFDLP